MDEIEKGVKGVIAEVVHTLHEKGVRDYFVGCTSAEGKDFAFRCQGPAYERTSESLEVMLSENPEKVNKQIADLLRAVAEWYDFDDRTIH